MPHLRAIVSSKITQKSTWGGKCGTKCHKRTPVSSLRAGAGRQLSSVQSLARVWLLATPWTAARQASLSITDSQSLLKLMSIKLVMPSNYLILCRPLLLLPSIFPSIRVFSNESVLCIRWPKYWSFSFSISPSNEHSELISFRMDWLDLLAVQGPLKSLLQLHSSEKAGRPFFVFTWEHAHRAHFRVHEQVRRTVLIWGLQRNVTSWSICKYRIHD